jgi:hypothetical protein
MINLPTRDDLPSRDEVLYWTNRTLKVLWIVTYGVLVLLLLAATVIMSLILAGLAHVSDEKRKSVLRGVRDQMLKFFVSFVIGISSLIDGCQNEEVLDYTTSASQPQLMIKQVNDEEQSFNFQNVFTASTPNKTSNQKDLQMISNQKNLMNCTGDLVEENMDLKDSVQKAEQFRGQRQSLDEYVKPVLKLEDTA